MIKVCVVCKQDKDVSMFHIDNSRNNKSTRQCKDCRKLYNQDIRSQRMALGLCRYCGNKNSNGLKHCNDCLDKHILDNKNIKFKVISHYGGKCHSCGELNIDFLTLDHINNDGHVDRKLNKSGSGTAYYRKLIKQNYPNNIQILCANCHLRKSSINNNMRAKRISWNEYYSSIVKNVAGRSTCHRLKVGAVLVKNNTIISTGYNGAPHGHDHCIDKGCIIIDNHCVRTIHAELNAIINAVKNGINISDSIIYVTHSPCMECFKHIMQAGISKIIYLEEYKLKDYKTFYQIPSGRMIDVQQIKD